VILQEASLMGHKVYGTDIEPRMIEYSQTNLKWFNLDNHFRLEQGDATSHKWEKPFDIVACETYLGRPLSSLPDRATMDKIINDCDTIHKKFLKNLATQTPKGFLLCIAVPAWKTKNGFLHLPTLDNLENLGYNRMSFVHADAKNLVYHRENQYVGRELVVLQRI
jgi:tRNA G10  N-methylase Trm11